jgi:hypothetical protein
MGKDRGIGSIRWDQAIAMANTGQEVQGQFDRIPLCPPKADHIGGFVDKSWKIRGKMMPRRAIVHKRRKSQITYNL